MSETAQTNEYVNTVKNDVVIIGKEHETYFYNEYGYECQSI
jgi:hypothetical protein